MDLGLVLRSVANYQGGPSHAVCVPGGGPSLQCKQPTYLAEYSRSLAQRREVGRDIQGRRMLGASRVRKAQGNLNEMQAGRASRTYCSMSHFPSHDNTAQAWC